jgi:hypothetical protein
MKDTTRNLIQAELDKQLDSIAAQLEEGKLPTERQLNDIDGLSKLKTLFPEENRGIKIWEIALLFFAALILLCAAHFRVPSSLVEVDVHLSSIRVGLYKNGSDLLLPGEHGEIVALKQANISGATELEPPWINNEGGTFELPESKSPAAPNTSVGVRLQALTIPANGASSLTLGVTYRPGLRGLVLYSEGNEPTKTSFGEVIAVSSDGGATRNAQFAIKSIAAKGNLLRVELFPLDAQTSFTVLRDVEITNVNFENVADSAILGGRIFVENLPQSRIDVQPGDHLQIKSDKPMMIRELVFSKGQLEGTIDVPSATAVLLGDKHPRNLLPSYLDRLQSSWPTQPYTTLATLVAIWLAFRQWWKPSR